MNARVRVFGLLVVVALMACGWSVTAQAFQYKVCNKSTEKAYLTTVHHTARNGWSSQGWWAIDPQGCQNFETDQTTVYLRANTDAVLRVWQGARSWCASEDRYEFPNADMMACNQPGQKKLNFIEWKLQGALPTYNLNDQDAVRVGSNVNVCNESDLRAFFAVAYKPLNGNALATIGWYGVDAHACMAQFLPTAGPDIYVHARTDREDFGWAGNNVMCADVQNAFNFADGATRPCDKDFELKLGFTRYTTDVSGRASVKLKPADAQRFGPTVNVCNRADDSVMFQLGFESAVGEGVITRGIYWIDPGACRTLSNPSRSNTVYGYAETARHKAVWKGDRELCVDLRPGNRGFMYHGADRTCSGVSHAWRPFFAVEAVDGVAQVEIKPEEAEINSVGLNLCNDTKERMWTSFAHADYDPSNGLAAHGWYALSPGECSYVAGFPSTVPVLLYAMTGSREWNGNDGTFCMDSANGFDFSRADTMNCTGGKLKQANARKLDLAPGVNVYAFGTGN